MRSLSRWISLLIVVAMMVAAFPMVVFAETSAVPSKKCVDTQNYLEENFVLLNNSNVEENEFSTEAYEIWVDGTKFSSEQEASGDNWTYQPENHELSLENYNGGYIYAGGDLSIVSYGETVICEEEWYAIGVAGQLIIICMEGSLTAYGGSPGYAAVISDQKVSCAALEDSIITIVGGSSNDKDHYGGDGIWAPLIWFFQYGGEIRVYGGNAIAPAVFGGYAVLGDKFFIYGDCTLKAGNGSGVSGAICMKEHTQIGRINATFAASGAGQSAFAWTGTASVGYVSYTHTEDFSEWTITPLDYTITFYGDGGTLNGKSFVTIDAPFDERSDPAEIDLGDYIFTRPGYKQTCWIRMEDNSLEISELDILYQPDFSVAESDHIELTAVWECVGPEVVTGDNNIMAVVPNDWCEEKAANTVILALYDQNGMLLDSKSEVWNVGQDICIDLMMEKKPGMTYTLFFLDNTFTPVSDPIRADIA